MRNWTVIEAGKSLGVSGIQPDVLLRVEAPDGDTGRRVAIQISVTSKPEYEARSALELCRIAQIDVVLVIAKNKRARMLIERKVKELKQVKITANKTTIDRRKLHLPKYCMKRPHMRKGGRGLKIPPVWEKWPDPQNPENTTGEVTNIPEGPDYGVSGLLAGDEDFGPEPWEKKVPASEEGETFPSEPEVEVKSDAGGLPQLPEPAPTPELPPVEPPVNPLPSVPPASLGKIAPLAEEPGLPDPNGPPGLPDQPGGEGIGKA